MKTQCPHCQYIIEADNRWLGLEAPCPNCRQDFIINPIIDEASQDDDTADSSESVIYCPFCGAVSSKVNSPAWSYTSTCLYCDEKLESIKLQSSENVRVTYSPPRFLVTTLAISQYVNALFLVMGVVSSISVWVSLACVSPSSTLLTFIIVVCGLFAGLFWLIPYVFLKTLIGILKSLHKPK